MLGSFANSSQGSSLASTRDALKTGDSVVARQDLLDGRALARAQVRMLLFDVTPGVGTDQRIAQILPSSHFGDVVALIANHLFRGERASWRLAFYFNQVTRLDTLVESLSHLGEARLAHRTFQSIAHQLALVCDCVAL